MNRKIKFLVKFYCREQVYFKVISILTNAVELLHLEALPAAALSVVAFAVALLTAGAGEVPGLGGV